MSTDPETSDQKTFREIHESLDKFEEYIGFNLRDMYSVFDERIFEVNEIEALIELIRAKVNRLQHAPVAQTVRADGS